MTLQRSVMISIGSKPALPLLICVKTLPGLLHVLCLWIQAIVWSPGASRDRGGRVSPSIQCPKVHTYCQVKPSLEPGFHPWHGIRVNRHALPAPCEGGGRRPRSGRAVGVIRRERFSDDTQETGEGGAVSASPLPVSPTPAGVIPHRYSVRGGDIPHHVLVEKLP